MRYLRRVKRKWAGFIPFPALIYIFFLLAFIFLPETKMIAGEGRNVSLRPGSQEEILNFEDLDALLARLGTADVLPPLAQVSGAAQVTSQASLGATYIGPLPTGASGGSEGLAGLVEGKLFPWPGLTFHGEFLYNTLAQKRNSLHLGAQLDLGNIILNALYSPGPRLNFAGGNAGESRKLALDRYNFALELKELDLTLSTDFTVLNQKQVSTASPKLAFGGEGAGGKGTSQWETTLRPREMGSGGSDKALVATSVALSYALANWTLIQAGVQFIDADTLEAVAVTSSAARVRPSVGVNANIPLTRDLQLSVGYTYTGEAGPAEDWAEAGGSQARAGVEVALPGGASLRADYSHSGTRLTGEYQSKFNLGYQFADNAALAFGYLVNWQAETTAETEGQKKNKLTTAELRISF